VAVLGEGGAADEVAAAHHDRQLHPHPGHLDALPGDVFQVLGLDPEPALVTKPLATDLQEHALVGGAAALRGLRHSGAIIAMDGRFTTEARRCTGVPPCLRASVVKNAIECGRTLLLSFAVAGR